MYERFQTPSQQYIVSLFISVASEKKILPSRGPTNWTSSATDNSLSVISKFTQFDSTVMATITEGLSLTLTGCNHISSDKP